MSRFRNRRILTSAQTEATTLKIDGDTFVNVNGNWYTEAAAKDLDPSGKPKAEEAAHVRTLMVDLEFAKTDEFLRNDDPAVSTKLGKAPEHRITITPRAGGEIALDLFTADGAADKYLVRVSGAPVVYRVPRSSFASMTKSAPGAKSEPAGLRRRATGRRRLPGDDQLNLDAPDTPDAPPATPPS